MYTTLDILKNTHACKPGFGRMLRFFGLDFNRTTPIPIHVIALVGGLTDAQWALSGSLVIDPEAYKELRSRTLASTFIKAMKDYRIIDDMVQVARKRKLPFAHADIEVPGEEEPKRVSRISRHGVKKSVSVDGTFERMREDNYAKLWSLLGFDNKDFTPGPYEDLEALLQLIQYAPMTLMGDRFSDALGRVYAHPRDYLQRLFSDYKSSFILRNGTTHDTLLQYKDTPKEGTDGFRIASLLKPVDTLSFLTTMDYRKPNLEVEELPSGKIRIVREIERESLEYLSLLRKTGGYIDQDVEDTNTNVEESYPEYEAVEVQEGNTVRWQYQETIRAARARSREDFDDESEEDDDI